MLFSSISFLYYFLPILLVVYFLTPRKGKNVVLLLASLLFYFWGEPSYTILLVASVLSGYVHGLIIDRYRGTKWSKAALISAIVISVGLLVVFKYADFIIDTLNGVLNAKIPLLKLALPIGISFYTFQLLSYIIDLYRGQTKVQKSFIKLATYVALFPQLIAGPIVRYSTVAQELESRTHSLSGFSRGSARFIIGLSKKVLLANTMGELCEIFKSSNDKSVLFIWMYAIAFALHIYFDFSGYSDMAIGLGRVFGLHFRENFKHPYAAASIREFWRGWHISLTSWFREYLYIPLGGNRKGKLRTSVNKGIVFLTTGIWHGANWTFVLWGLWHGLFSVLEDHGIIPVDRWRNSSLGRGLCHVYTMLVVILGFVMFRSDTISQTMMMFQKMFSGFSITPEQWLGLQELCSPMLLFAILISGVLSLPVLPKIRALAEKKGGRILDGVERSTYPLTLALLLLCIMNLSATSFNPFIYFQF